MKDLKPQRVKNFPIVCVGGSAGGLDAYIRLLQNLPDELGAVVVIITHQRTGATLLHEILQKYTKMPVELITEKLDVEPLYHVHPLLPICGERA